MCESAAFWKMFKLCLSDTPTPNDEAHLTAERMAPEGRMPGTELPTVGMTGGLLAERCAIGGRGTRGQVQ